MIRVTLIVVSLLVFQSAPMLPTIPVEVQRKILSKLNESELQVVQAVDRTQSKNVGYVLEERHQNWMKRKRVSGYNAAFELIQRAKSKPLSIQQLKYALKLCHENHDVSPHKRRRLMAASGHFDDNLKSVSEYMFDNGFANHDAAQLCFNPILFEQEKNAFVEKITSMLNSPHAITSLSLTERQKLILDLPIFLVQGRARKIYLTVLQYAIARNRLDLARLLMHYEPDLERLSEGDIKSPALFFASRYKEMVQLLISNGADVNGIGRNGKSCLHFAAQKGDRDSLQLLLENGADVESKEPGLGSTLLMTAAQFGYNDIVIALLKNGADLNAQNSLGQTSLFIASLHGKREVAETLINSGADINLKSKDGSVPIHAATRNGHTKIIQLLLEHGAHVDTRSHFWESNNQHLNRTPLYSASYYGHLDTVQFLLEHGADVNAETALGITPLNIASAEGHLNVVEALITANANLNKRDNQDQGPLFYASRNGHIEIVRLLLKHSAQVDLATIRNAAEHHNFGIVFELSKAIKN